MMQLSINYAKVIRELGIPEEAVWETRRLFEETPELLKALSSQAAAIKEKYRVIDRVFPEEMRRVLKTMCAHHSMDCIPELFDVYKQIISEDKGILLAELSYHKAPAQEQLEGIKAFLCRRFEKDSVEMKLIQNPGMLGGFVLRAGGWEFDWSIRGRIRQLQQRLTRR